MHSEFSKVLANEMKHYSESRDVDTIAKVHGELDELKDIMVQNIGEFIKNVYIFFCIIFIIVIDSTVLYNIFS